MDLYRPRRNTMKKDIPTLINELKGLLDSAPERFTPGVHKAVDELQAKIEGILISEQYDLLPDTYKVSSGKFAFKNDIEAQVAINEQIKRSKKVDVPTEQWQKGIEKRIEALENRCASLDDTLRNSFDFNEITACSAASSKFVLTQKKQGFRNKNYKRIGFREPSSTPWEVLT